MAGIGLFSGVRGAAVLPEPAGIVSGDRAGSDACLQDVERAGKLKENCGLPCIVRRRALCSLSSGEKGVLEEWSGKNFCRRRFSFGRKELWRLPAEETVIRCFDAAFVQQFFGSARICGIDFSALIKVTNSGVFLQVPELLPGLFSWAQRDEARKNFPWRLLMGAARPFWPG